MRKIFGTDGIRGKAGVKPLTPDFIVRLAQAIGAQFMRGDHRHCIVIGKDTRLSGYMVESALTTGFVSIGMDVILVGALPTPAIAMLTRSLRADLGVVISASHNPFEDNGIKIFDPYGKKLSDEIERQIEARLERSIPTISAEAWGYVRHLTDAEGRYIEFVKASFPRFLSLEGWRLVVDCAHGATYKVAPMIFQELGATVIPLGVHPDGCNINAGCGALSPGLMQQAVQDHQAHLGIAFDGDGDRLILSDENGQLIDGDQILALIAQSWRKIGRLQGNTVIGTLMSNLGLERFLQQQNLNFIRTSVGDRYISEEMIRHHSSLGGEQSGHILLPDYHTSGDGLIAALQVLAVLAAQPQPTSDIFPLFTPVPQILKNIRLPSRSILDAHPVQKYLKKISKNLGAKGRIVARPSGTEQVVRIMIEGDDFQMIQALADEVANFLLSYSEESVA